MENSYYRLHDINHKDVIVRTEGPIEHKYVHNEGWIRSALMTHYFCDESDYYDLYEEITESEALALIEQAKA